MIDDPRLERFQRLGGVDLARVDPEEKPLLTAMIRDGVVNVPRGRFRFCCPTCRNVVANDQEMSPLCTGPRWTNDHEPTVMVPL